MGQTTIRQYISEVRGDLKMNNADNRLADRHIYLQMLRVRPLLLKQSKQWLMGVTEIFQTIPDTVEACGIKTNCTIKRSKEKLPEILEDYQGPIIKLLTSIDGYDRLRYITASSYIRKREKKTFKYDKTLYFWFKNGYLYFPNVEWDKVSIEAYLLQDYVDPCNEEEVRLSLCKDYQENLFRLPDALQSPLVALTIERLIKTYSQLPQDTIVDKNENKK